MAKLTKMGAIISLPNIAYSDIRPEVEADTPEDALDFLAGIARQVGADKWADSVAPKKQATSQTTPGIKCVMAKKSIDGTEVLFDPINHVYTDPDGKVKYMGGSTFASLVATEFDSRAVAQKVAKDGLTADQVLNLWSMKNKVSCDFGESIHKALETYQKFHSYTAILGGEEKILPNSPYLQDVVRNFFTPERKEEQAMPEVFVANHKYGLCGFIDRLVFLDKDTRTVEVQDFKGLALDTPIPTPNGFTTMGDLKVGDKVFGGDGNVCTVTNKSNIHHKECYKITFTHGEEVIADYDHKWLVVPQVANKEGKAGFEESVLETHDLKQGMKIKLTTINDNKDDACLPIDPYVLGAWLGDGCKSAPSIANPNKDLWDEIISRGYNISPDYNKKGDRCETHRLYGLSRELKNLNLIGNKHIPDEYITTTSYNQRLELLRGIMDTDGYWNKTRSRAVLNTTQWWFARDVIKLLSSLGIKASMHEHTAKGFGLTKKAWYIDFLPKDNPFLVRNQDIHYPSITKKGDHKYIKSVERIDSVPTQCIVVDSPDHTYLYGYWFTKTHNSNDLSKKVTFIPPIREAYKDVPKNKLGEYMFQLSFYAFILKDMGYNVKSCRIFNLDDTEWKEEEFKPLDITDALKIVRG